MKKLISILALSMLIFFSIKAQDQTVNGNLTVATPVSPAGGGITIGKVGYGGTLGVPVGGVSLQYSIDFPGYRDVVHDQVGARISALRINNYQDGYSGVQNTALAFYTNYLGTNAGIVDLVERMRIAPNGNVGIGTNNPICKFDVRGNQYIGGTLLMHSPAGNYAEGIRVTAATNNWVTLALGAVGNEGTNENMWSIHRTDKNDFTISRNSSDGANGIVVTKAGNVGFGIINPTHKLDVNGTIHAKEVKIDNNGWADFVFDKDYKLPTLAEVEAHIQEHKRLPEIPSEADVKEKGVNIGEMHVKLLQKIEELTLYMIKQQKELEELKHENEELRKLMNGK